GRARGRARAAHQERGQEHARSRESRGHTDDVTRPGDGLTVFKATVLKATQSAIKVIPNAHTTVAPVGRSKLADATIPMTLTSVPNAQPIKSFWVTVRPSMMPASAGTIRYEKTSSTPAILTELVTTTPNEA